MRKKINLRRVKSMVKLEVLKGQVNKKKAHLITQETVDEINKLIEDPDYGEEFLDAYVQFFDVTSQNSNWSTPKYMNALKFFMLIEAGHTAVDAYCKVFPERLEARFARGETKRDIGGEASRYNASQTVNEIRKVAGVNVKLIHRHTFHRAIEETTKIGLDKSVSPAVRQKAWETLIRELKPDEKSEISIEIKSDMSAIDQLRMATEALVIEQRRSIEAGMSVKYIAESAVVEAEVDDD